MSMSVRTEEFINFLKVIGWTTGDITDYVFKKDNSSYDYDKINIVEDKVELFTSLNDTTETPDHVFDSFDDFIMFEEDVTED